MLIGTLFSALLVLALAGWIVEGARKLLRPRAALRPRTA